uniref:helix-turn-helix domain-containing protein n=1 Tax=Aliarcobacter sp. TaxID=2321116 RepID=UPI00404737F4
MNIPYENLDLIPNILNQLQQLTNEIAQLKSQKKKIDLTKLTNVSKYLNVSKTTIYNMIDDGRFKQNIHYKKHINNNSVKIIFVESAIIKYKKEFL